MDTAPPPASPLMQWLNTPSGCLHTGPDLQPDHNGDPACKPCRTEWATHPDQR